MTRDEIARKARRELKTFCPHWGFMVDGKNRYHLGYYGEDGGEYTRPAHKDTLKEIWASIDKDKCQGQTYDSPKATFVYFPVSVYLSRHGKAQRLIKNEEKHTCPNCGKTHNVGDIVKLNMACINSAKCQSEVILWTNSNKT